MKRKIFIYVALFLFVSRFVNAQNTFPSSGNVGIGTTTPSIPLQVIGHLAASNVSGGSLTGFVQNWADNALIWKYGNTNGGLRFGSATDLAAGGFSEKMRITDGGYVGIGTNSPTNTLDVRGNIYTNGTMQVDGGDLYISRTSQTFGYVLRPNVTGYKALQFAVAGGGPLDAIYLNSALSYFTGKIGAGISTPVADIEAYNQLSSSPQSILFLHSASFSTPTNAQNSYFLKAQDDGSGATQFVLRGDGSIGIGTSTPATKIDMQTTSANDGLTMRYTSTGFIRIHPNSLSVGSWNNLTQAGDAGIIYGGTAMGGGTFGFIISPWANATTGMRIDQNGNVGIATGNTQGYQLAVNGSAIFTKAVVKLYSNWPDYVFDPKYSLPSITEVEKYIQQNKHLPEIPSQADINEKGIDVGANQALLLKKIEELTLYIIDQNKEIEKLKGQNEKLELLQQKIEMLEKKILQQKDN
ncbi:MAG: hypothetical protein JST87_18660 [Bacteroidetes bacterium]|nr:hypothetical protein [Bacteroidota bacterium]